MTIAGPRIDNAALYAILASLADNKQAIGRRYAYWSNGAPALEAAVAASAMTQDEIGHARSLYPLLDTFVQAGDDPDQNDPMQRSMRYHVAALDHDFAGWSDFVATNFLLDTALTTFFEAALNSSYEPLAQRARKIVQEERTHKVHGEGWVRRLANAGGAVRTDLVAALLRIWPETLCWFGPENDPTMQQLYRDGVIDASPDTLRSRYLNVVMPVLNTLSIEVPATLQATPEQWALSRPLSWSQWNATYRRLG